MIEKIFRYFFPKIVHQPESKRLHIQEVDWDQVDVLKKFPKKGLVFREINHYKHGPRIYVYRGGTVGGGHLGICKTCRPESFYDGITITGILREGDNLILLFE